MQSSTVSQRSWLVDQMWLIKTARHSWSFFFFFFFFWWNCGYQFSWQVLILRCRHLSWMTLQFLTVGFNTKSWWLEKQHINLVWFITIHSHCFMLTLIETWIKCHIASHIAALRLKPPVYLVIDLSIPCESPKTKIEASLIAKQHVRRRRHLSDIDMQCNKWQEKKSQQIEHQVRKLH